MSKWVVIGVLILSIALQAADRVSIIVAVLPNSFLLTCRVPPAAENQWLNMGVFQFYSSGFDVKGKSAPAVFSRQFPLPGCDTDENYETAFCELFYSHDKYTIAHANVPCLR